jgi:hypothetical protein
MTRKKFISLLLPDRRLAAPSAADNLAQAVSNRSIPSLRIKAERFLLHPEHRATGNP